MYRLGDHMVADVKGQRDNENEGIVWLMIGKGGQESPYDIGCVMPLHGKVM